MIYSKNFEAVAVDDMLIEFSLPHHDIRLVAISGLVSNAGGATIYMQLSLADTGQNALKIAGPAIPAGTEIQWSAYGESAYRETAIADQVSVTPLPRYAVRDQWRGHVNTTASDVFDFTQGVAWFEAVHRGPRARAPYSPPNSG